MISLCPRCGDQPEFFRVGTRFWSCGCKKQHLPYRLIGHPMKTKKEALEQWELLCIEMLLIAGKPESRTPEAV